MSNINLQDLNSPAVPFFARYLEGQCEDLSVEEMEAVTGGYQATTRKYPSDHEEGGGGIVTTLKYPSDNEEGGGGIVTAKYPSDNEEGGGGTVTTQKYPSDGDDEAFSVE